MEARRARRAVAAPIDRRLGDLGAALARLQALDPAEVKRAVGRSTGLGEDAIAELVGQLLDRLALQVSGAERSARALRALGQEAEG